jgi:hypothetical protein
MFFIKILFPLKDKTRDVLKQNENKTVLSTNIHEFDWFQYLKLVFFDGYTTFPGSVEVKNKKSRI